MSISDEVQMVNCMMQFARKVNQQEAQLSDLQRENAALRADKERLDWLINNQINYATNEYGTIGFDQFDKIDRAEIDRARKEAKP